MVTLNIQQKSYQIMWRNSIRSQMVYHHLKRNSRYVPCKLIFSVHGNYEYNNAYISCWSHIVYLINRGICLSTFYRDLHWRRLTLNSFSQPRNLLIKIKTDMSMFYHVRNLNSVFICLHMISFKSLTSIIFIVVTQMRPAG